MEFIQSIMNDYILPKKWYIIEGNIGCGKTTLIRNLKNSGDFEVIEEPVEEWKNIKNEEGENILGLFYKDSPKYAYLFQTIVFKSRIRSLEFAQNKRIRFSERSIWTDKNIFSKNCFEMGLMNTVEKATYDLWFNWLESKIRRMPDGIIYLRASPELCHERMKKRDRVEEHSVSVDYLSKIHDKHEDWLNHATDYHGIPVHIIDNALKPKDSLDAVLKIIQHDTSFRTIGRSMMYKMKTFLDISIILNAFLFNLVTNFAFMPVEMKNELMKELKEIPLLNKIFIYTFWICIFPMFVIYCCN